MKWILLISSFLSPFFGFGSLQAQAYLGTWAIESSDFSLAPGRQEALPTPETCVWRDLHTSDAKLLLGPQGQVSFPIDEEFQATHYSVEDETLTIHFTNSYNYSSYIEYAIVVSGNKLMLSREDPLVVERHVFRRTE